MASRWTQAALSCEPAEQERAEAAVRLAYRSAGHPEPSRFLWCPSPPAALQQVRRLLEDGHTSLVASVRRDALNRALTAARAPIWEQTSDHDRFTAFGDFHDFMEWHGYYGEQRYDGFEARYNLMEHRYLCNPVTKGERSALTPVLRAVRQVYEQVLGPVWTAIDRTLTGSYIMQFAWYWSDEQTIVKRDDEGRAVIRYCLNPRDWFFDPAWNLYPDWLVLAAIDTYQQVLGTAPTPEWEGCRDVALAAGPWWPLSGAAVMMQRPTVLRVTGDGLLHGVTEPAVVWPDGSTLWARHGAIVIPG
ncbi:hypothetical protein CSH63_04435 [Micromonospora tulbaghiae]|uniref:DUF6745 domain-containing protein n=1 Tax=Micromonospora tulbaghiae TaxID=479978 RepID=A0A386WF47_9ACTN|nr:hypothetical protein CSH63_04435 [Micromonospora tulbaghiae]